MPILYNKDCQTITLQTNNTTYQMKMSDYGISQHSYYGSKVLDDDLSVRWKGYDRGFSGNPNEAGGIGAIFH